MRSLHIGVFDPKLIHSASPHCGDEMFAKGFEANGFQVTRFDYRKSQDPNQELSALPSGLSHQYDIIWLGKCERVNSETLQILKEKFPTVKICKWAADVNPEGIPFSHDASHLKYVNFFIGTFGGDYLRKHKELMPQNSIAMSLITFTDSDFYKPVEQTKEYQSDILWTGRWGSGTNKIRQQIIENLLLTKKYNVRIFGIENTVWVQKDYVNYISNAKIGIGANHSNIMKYSSDRLGNYMSCGTFYLAHYFEGLEEVFKRGVHLDWFNSVEEMNEKIDYYLKNENKRLRIAKKGRELILKYFDCYPLVSNLLYSIKHGKSKYPWDDIFTN